MYSNRLGSCYTLTEYLAERVSIPEDFELLAPVKLSICCFRYVPPLLVTRLQSADEAERASVNAEMIDSTLVSCLLCSATAELTSQIQLDVGGMPYTPAQSTSALLVPTLTQSWISCGTHVLIKLDK